MKNSLSTSIEFPKVVTREEWLVARKELVAKEVEATKLQDAVSEGRRNLPMVRIDKEYVFEGPDGTVTAHATMILRYQAVLRHSGVVHESG